LLIHLVDASNPRFVQQIESVERILRELKLAEIPTILALNKADLMDAEEMQASVRQVTHDRTRDVIVISATDPRSIEPLLEKAGAVLARNLMIRTGDEESREAEAISRIA
jgi:GTP-binding protein HflX